ncbi:MAG: hypothetical protein QOF15_4415 [Mycobacterium sp.]|nr:hypothetical protein [Mycobacterium sp.]
MREAGPAFDEGWISTPEDFIDALGKVPECCVDGAFVA